MSSFWVISVPIMVVCFIRVGYFKTILRPLNTLVHELSHAIIALVLGQKVKSISINNDGSGTCIIKSNSRIKSFLISFAGYIIPSLFGYFIICEIYDSNVTMVLYLLTILGLIALIFYIRNTFAVLWIVGFCTFNITLLFVPYFYNIREIFLYLYACILLIENFLSTIELFHLNLISSKKSGDSYNLQKTTHIPSIFFTLLFMVFSLFMVCKSFVVIKSYL